MSNDFSRTLQPAPDWAEVLGRPSRSFGPIVVGSARGQRILVTGAGGFIGSEMVRVLAASGAERIILLEIAEQKLFEITEAMRGAGYGDHVVPVLGSVGDWSLLQSVFAEHRPELVLHAAALKHVPLMEHNPLAAVATNSVGTWLVARAAEAHGARQMILVSTDKAVEPHSMMGASKRIAELALLARSRMRTSVVRLANVIGSPCSVGPVFAEQIAHGGPVTVTHPAARRFFLTLQDVIALLAEALDSDAAEGLLVPDAGEAILIADLARRMMARSGRAVDVVMTGLRPGDKVDESLIAMRERYEGWATPGLRRVRSGAPADVEDLLGGVEEAVGARDLALVLRLVQQLVPDYEPSSLVREAAAELSSSPA